MDLLGWLVAVATNARGSRTFWATVTVILAVIGVAIVVVVRVAS